MHRGRTVSKRRKTRKAKSAREMRFQKLFETAKDGILILDAESHEILEANPSIVELFHCRKGHLVGKKLSELGVLSGEMGCQKVFSQLDHGTPVRFEHTVRNPHAAQMTQLEFVCNSYEESGRKLIQCNIRDIGERRDRERQLREALQQSAEVKQELEARVQERTADLQQRNGELEAFSYSLSHDLRAPIRAIVSFTQLALDEYGKRVGPPATTYLEKAVSAAQRLDHLILDVLAFSKASRQRLTRENLDVEPLLRQILMERPEWAPPKAEVEIEHPLLPVRGDPASLTQCLTNLLDNAIKFVPAGKTARVRVSTQRLPGLIRLRVEDNGIGIPESARARIFELFQRAHNGYEGHGIGLAIVRRAAERMGGTVGMSSEPGQGSSFWIDLPPAELARD
jgi:PAS domain S-box-containing protein